MKIRVKIVLVAFAAAVAAGPAWSQPPLADKVPAGTLIHVGWAGRSLAFDGSFLGQLLVDPDVKRLVGAVHAAVGEQLAGQEDGQAIFNRIWAMAKIGWEHPAAIALFDIVPASPEAAESGRDDIRPVGAVLVALQKDKAAFEGELQALLAVAGKNIEITRATAGEVSYHWFDTPAGPCGLGFVGDTFFMSLGEQTPQTIASIARGRAKSLATDPAFAAAMKEVVGESAQSVSYFNVARGWEIIDKLVSARSTTAPAGQSDFRRAISAFGVDRVTAIAGAANIVGRGIHQKTRIFTPAPHRGLLMLLSGPALTPQALAGVPADADLAVAFRLDAGKLLAEFKNVVAALEPEAVDKINAALAEAGEQLGLDIEKELLAELGDELTLCSAESLGGFLTGTVLAVSVKDDAKFCAALCKIETFLTEQIGPGAGLTIRSIKSDELEVHYLAALGRKVPLPVAPAWAVHKGRLYLAAFPQVVIAAATGTNEKPLTSAPDFVALRKRVAAPSSALAYVNTPQLLRRLYGLGLVGWTTAANILAAWPKPVLLPDMLPPLTRLEKYILPDIAVMTADAKGITFESYGSLPGGGCAQIGLIPIQAASTAILVPVMKRARHSALRQVSRANLMCIGQACAMYQCENDDRIPPDLVTLVEKEYLHARLLYSPATGRKPRYDQAGKLTGPFDYVYLASEVAMPVDMILAYERPEINKGRGTNILCRGLTVRWVSMETLRRELQRRQAHISKHSQ